MREGIDERFRRLRSEPETDMKTRIRRIFEQHPDPADHTPQASFRPMTILIDTGPLVALCDGRHAKHRIAVKHLESLSSGEFAVAMPS